MFVMIPPASEKEPWEETGSEQPELLAETGPEDTKSSRPRGMAAFGKKPRRLRSDSQEGSGWGWCFLIDLLSVLSLFGPR